MKDIYEPEFVRKLFNQMSESYERMNYKMLWIYTKSFGNCEKLIEIFKRNGLKVNYDSYFFGCASGISGFKFESYL